MTNEPNEKTFEQRLADVIRTCALGLNDVSREMRDHCEDLQGRLIVADRTVHMLQEQVRVAQNREKDLLSTNSEKDRRIADLESSMQAIEDQMTRLRDGRNMRDRSAKGEPMFVAPQDQEQYDAVVAQMEDGLKALVEQSQGKPARPAGRLAKIFGREETTVKEGVPA